MQKQPKNFTVTLDTKQGIPREITFKKCKVVMLPTEKATSIIKNIKDNKLSFGKIIEPQFVRYGEQGQYLYILSDDEVKENDHIFNFAATNQDNIIVHCQTLGSLMAAKNNADVWKKIIATNDPILNKIGISELPDSFIKEYCENGGFNEIMVEYEPNLLYPMVQFNNTKLKVAPDNTITTKKVKENWSREEIIALVRPLIETIEGEFGSCTKEGFDMATDKWVEENL